MIRRYLINQNSYVSADLQKTKIKQLVENKNYGKLYGKLKLILWKRSRYAEVMVPIMQKLMENYAEKITLCKSWWKTLWKTLIVHLLKTVHSLHEFNTTFTTTLTQRELYRRVYHNFNTTFTITSTQRDFTTGALSYHRVYHRRGLALTSSALVLSFYLFLEREEKIFLERVKPEMRCDERTPILSLKIMIRTMPSVNVATVANAPPNQSLFLLSSVKLFPYSYLIPFHPYLLLRFIISLQISIKIISP